ncbi:hypothetical protein D3C75_1263460 [compost metagenome]
MSATYNQQVILGGNLELLLGESCHRDRDAVMIFIHQLNVIRRIAAITLALPSLQRVKQAVKTNGGTV